MSNVQFPYPRKSEAPPSLKPARSTPAFRPRDLKQLLVYIAGGVTFFLLILWLFSGSPSTPSLPAGTPEVVIVTTLDPSMSETFRENIIANRRDYATRHGYVTFFPNTTDYNLMPGVPRSWSSIPSLRHAMTNWPQTPWLFYLSSDALIMDPHESLAKKVLEPTKLESLMIADKPVVPPDSVIKTIAHMKADRVDLILTQDREGLAGGSILIRTGEWAKYFLDAWFDPLYRSYNFQKAENHALEHLVQWHGTVLAKLALIPQRAINSYMKEAQPASSSDGGYEEGDFVANFASCSRDSKRDCELEMAPMISRWREMRDQERLE